MIIQKPIIKTEWRGQKGNMWRCYTVISANGSVMHFQNKEDALMVFNANKQVYKIVSKKRKAK